VFVAFQYVLSAGPPLERVVGVFEIGSTHGHVVLRFTPSSNAQGVDFKI